MRMYSDDLAEAARSSSRAASDKMFQSLSGRRQRDLDEAVKYAQLAEMGYQVQPGRQGMFGGGSPTTITRNEERQVPTGYTLFGRKLVKDPTYFNADQERQKQRIKMEEMRDVLGAGSDVDDEIARIRQELEALPEDEDYEDDSEDEQSPVMEDPLESDARRAIAQGADPQLVNKRLQELRGKRR